MLEGMSRFEVCTCASSQKAVSEYRPGVYDAIIADYEMPELDGIEFLRRVRSVDQLVPFILFTGKGREEVAIRALNEGADFYLKKGPETQSVYRELLNATEQVISRRRAEKELQHSERWYKSLIENLTDMIVAADMTGLILYTSPSVQQVLGFRPDEVVKTNIAEYVHPDYGDLMASDRQWAPGEQRRGLVKVKDKRGKWHLGDVSIKMVKYKDNGGDRLIINARDVTDRSKSCEHIAMLNRKLNICCGAVQKEMIENVQVILEAVNQAMIVSQNKRMMVECDVVRRSAERIFELAGYSKGYMKVGASPPQWVLLNDLIAQESGVLKDAGIEVISFLSEIEILADPQMPLVFKGIFGNTVDHGGNATKVMISWAEDQVMGGRLSIIDDGVGIRELKKKIIFDFESSGTHSLYFAKEILQVTGASITEAGTAGVGATFEITFPTGTFRPRLIQ